ncbi:unnamed protein product [Adineta ricciae]|uniref:Sushi domain-containing protein n=1 Tax=Adineta ricciae TaxID=249248 RepID=A0A813X5V0_ADIRI|nr:unnamed protein product [Adineta ricciae]
MRTSKIKTSSHLLQFFVVWQLVSLTEAYWIRDLSYCPRKRDVTRQRQCFKSCFDDSDCRSRYRSCVCDYDCGMSCVKRGISCPFLAPPDHGRIVYSNENKFGSRATYECEAGFVLEGPKHRHCQGDMWWGPSDSVPYCTKEVFCPRPPDIANAVNDIPSSITTFHAGYSIQYTCLTGFVGNGTTTSECAFLGQWTFATLKCIPIDCGPPGVLRDGFLSGERFDYPNIIAFFCNDGFELVGKHTTRACQENGLWSGSMPVCQKKSCGAPPLVTHGEIIQPDRTTNDTVQYTCEDGYHLQGSSILKCLAGEWQPKSPVCEPITCKDPQTNFNGYVELLSNQNLSQYSIDSIVKFHCPNNLTLKGSRVSKCHVNGSWVPNIPICAEPISCSIPFLPPTARYVNHDPSMKIMKDGSRLEYVCGHLRHRRRVFCRQGKTFPRVPKCYIGCRVHNNEVLFSKRFYRHKEIVEYICKNNSSSPLNNETIRCINGTLSKQPTCRKVPSMCTVPHILFLRNIATTTIPAGTLFQMGTSFSYTCSQDFQPVNESGMVECLEDGRLSHHARCVPKSCEEHPPSINNGRTIFHSTMHSSIAKYRCFPGYRLENHNFTTVTCQYGLWLPKELPKCLPIFCPNPGPLEHGTIYVVLNDERISAVPTRSEFRSYIPTVNHGRTIEFECDLGYGLQGPTGLTCVHGRWLPAERPSCVPESHIQPNIVFTG